MVSSEGSNSIGLIEAQSQVTKDMTQEQMKTGAIVMADKTLALYDPEKTGFIPKEDAAALIEYIAKPMFDKIQADMQKMREGMPPEMAANFKGPSYDEIKTKCWTGLDFDKDGKLSRIDLYYAYAGMLHAECESKKEGAK